MVDELVPLYNDLYLKSIHKVSITVHLPKLRQMGQSVSNWEIRERLKKMLKLELSDFKVVESTLEIVHFAAFISLIEDVKYVIKTLDGITFRTIGFTEPLTISAHISEIAYPNRVDWDKFFSENRKHMDEREPGERPDTIYLCGLPFTYFQTAIDGNYEKTFKRIFSEFGEVAYVDIPQCDPYRKQMDSDISGLCLSSWSYGEDLFFEVYIQFKEYTGFVNAMLALCGKVLIKKSADNSLNETRFKVDFDRTAHLSIRKITQRALRRACIEYEKDQKALKELMSSRKLEEMIVEEKRRRENKEREKLYRRLLRAEKRNKLEEQRNYEHILRKKLKVKLTKRLKSSKKERETGAKALLSYIAKLYREQQRELKETSKEFHDMASQYIIEKGLPSEKILRKRIIQKAELSIRTRIAKRLVSRRICSVRRIREIT